MASRASAALVGSFNVVDLLAPAHRSTSQNIFTRVRCSSRVWCPDIEEAGKKKKKITKKRKREKRKTEDEKPENQKRGGILQGLGACTPRVCTEYGCISSSTCRVHRTRSPPPLRILVLILSSPLCFPPPTLPPWQMGYVEDVLDACLNRCLGMAG